MKDLKTVAGWRRPRHLMNQGSVVLRLEPETEKDHLVEKLGKSE